MAGRRARPGTDCRDAGQPAPLRSRRALQRTAPPMRFSSAVSFPGEGGCGQAIQVAHGVKRVGGPSPHRPAGRTEWAEIAPRKDQYDPLGAVLATTRRSGRTTGMARSPGARFARGATPIDRAPAKAPRGIAYNRPMHDEAARW